MGIMGIMGIMGLGLVHAGYYIPRPYDGTRGLPSGEITQEGLSSKTPSQRGGDTRGRSAFHVDVTHHDMQYVRNIGTELVDRRLEGHGGSGSGSGSGGGGGSTDRSDGGGGGGRRRR